MLIYTQAKSVDVFHLSVVTGSVTSSWYMTLNASDDANVIIAALFHIPDVTEWECGACCGGRTNCLACKLVSADKRRKRRGKNKNKN